MHEKMLQFADNSQYVRYLPNGFSNMTGYGNGMKDAAIAVTNKAPRLSVSPVLPGTGNVTHNIASMLGNPRQTFGNEMIDQKARDIQILPYSTSHFMSFRHKALREYNSSYDPDVTQECSESDSSTSDMSISTERSISPYTSDSASPSTPRVEIATINRSPTNSEILLSENEQSGDISSCGIDDCPAKSERIEESSQVACADKAEDIDNSNNLPKKNARTNFTNDQVKTLIKIFHETPYPDSEMMENIAVDLKLKEKQVKIWFQNKRARWRRRVNDNRNNAKTLVPTTPMMSQATSFGYMPMGHMMMSSPFYNFHGNMSHPWIQGHSSHYMYQNHLGQNVANQIPHHSQTLNQNLGLKCNASYSMNTAPSVPMSSAQYGKMPSQHYSQFPNGHYSFLHRN